MRIRSVRLTNYKRFTDLSIEGIPSSARLVVLIGPNGTGKSSLFDAFLLKSQGLKSNYRLQGERGDYYLKDSLIPGHPDTTQDVWGAIQIEFHSSEPSRDDWPAIFNIRSPYRNEADFQLTNLERVSPSTEGVRFSRIIDSDQAVSDNYRRLTWKRMADLDTDAPGSTTFEQYRRDSLGELQAAMSKLFTEPTLELKDFGGIRDTGVFRFAKAAASDFHYKNLSGGEKAAFDLLLDVFVKRNEYQNAIYCIDEPEAHVATALHGLLLEVVLDIMPFASQLWIATHSIGFVRKAYEMMLQKGDVVFLDFSSRNFDEAAKILPCVPDRSFWHMTYKVALDDLADLIAPAKIIICEGASTKADKGFDAQCYNNLFEDTHPDWLFVSHGSANEVTQSDALIAVLEAVARGSTIARVIDRDEMTDGAREEKIAGGLRVLRRRELENYLYDSEVLKTFLLMNNQEEAEELVFGELDRLLAGSDATTADMKKVTQEFFASIKTLTGLSNLGNSRSEFALQHLVPALKNTSDVLQELEEDLF